MSAVYWVELESLSMRMSVTKLIVEKVQHCHGLDHRWFFLPRISVVRVLQITGQLGYVIVDGSNCDLKKQLKDVMADTARSRYEFVQKVANRDDILPLEHSTAGKTDAN